MSDTIKNNKDNSRIIHILKDVSIVIGLILVIMGVLGVFFNLKEDVAVIKTSIKYIEEDIKEIKTNYNK